MSSGKTRSLRVVSSNKPYSLFNGEDSAKLVKFKETLFPLFGANVAKWSNEIASRVQVNESCSQSHKTDIIKVTVIFFI